MRIIHRPLLIFVLHVVKHPVRVLIMTAITLAWSGSIAAWKLNLATDQNRLFDPNVKFFRDFLSFTHRFPENGATYVLTEPTNRDRPPPVARWTAIADAIAAKLKTMPQYVRAVDAKVPAEQLGAQGLLFDDPANVRQSFQDVKRFIP